MPRLWTHAEIGIGCNPSTAVYPSEEAANILRNFKTHEIFFNESITLSKADKLINFSKDI